MLNAVAFLALFGPPVVVAWYFCRDARNETTPEDPAADIKAGCIERACQYGPCAEPATFASAASGHWFCATHAHKIRRERGDAMRPLHSIRETRRRD